MNSNQVIRHFLSCYKSKYGTEIKPSWAKDSSIIKNKFLKTMSGKSDQEIKRVIEIIVENYDNWSTNKNYKLGLHTLNIEWIVTKAVDEIEREAKEKSQMKKRIVEATKRNEKTLDSILSRINKGGN